MNYEDMIRRVAQIGRDRDAVERRNPGLALQWDAERATLLDALPAAIAATHRHRELLASREIARVRRTHRAAIKKLRQKHLRAKDTTKLLHDRIHGLPCSDPDVCPGPEFAGASTRCCSVCLFRAEVIG